ncbi:MAG: hypothetical protein AB7I38_19960 [Dehalococcoidia bacterium]
MARQREQLSAEALERQAALDRSWVDAQRALTDPASRSGLERMLERLDAAAPALVLTRAEFLARTLPVE